MLDCGFAEFLHRALHLSFGAKSLPQMEEGLYLAGCHDVAQTQDYYLVCNWSSLIKLQGCGVVSNLTCFRTVVQFYCAVCMQAMTHSVENVLSQEQFNW